MVLLCTSQNLDMKKSSLMACTKATPVGCEMPLIHKGKFFCLISKQSDEGIDFQGLGDITSALSTKLSTSVWGN
jgi:hypothetical protein